MRINEIAEIEKGIFHSNLDFPDQRKLLNLVVDKEIPYVLLVGVQSATTRGKASRYGE